jgi:hypothetical protein
MIPTADLPKSPHPHSHSQALSHTPRRCPHARPGNRSSCFPPALPGQAHRTAARQPHRTARTTSSTASPAMTKPAATPTRSRSSHGATATILDAAGPGIITHIWFTIATTSPAPQEARPAHLLGRRATPSVETPIGDFFGLGLGEYYLYESAPLSVASDKALNSFFQMPFRKKARITVTNEGRKK